MVTRQDEENRLQPSGRTPLAIYRPKPRGKAGRRFLSLTHYCMGLLIVKFGLLILTCMCSVLYSASSFALKLSVFICREKGITFDKATHQSESAFLKDLRARGQPTHTHSHLHKTGIKKLVVLH